MTVYTLRPTADLVPADYSGFGLTPPYDLIVGTGAVLADDDDATYIHVGTGSDGTDWRVSGVLTPLDAAATADNITGITWHARASTEETGGYVDITFDGGFDGSEDAIMGSVDASITRDGLPHDLSDAFDPDTRDDWLAALHDGIPFSMNLSLFDDGGPGFYIYELWIEVTTASPTSGVQPRRIFQRSL
jgi:hypothetical protein